MEKEYTMIEGQLLTAADIAERGYKKLYAAEINGAPLMFVTTKEAAIKDAEHEFNDHDEITVSEYDVLIGEDDDGRINVQLDYNGETDWLSDSGIYAAAVNLMDDEIREEISSSGDFDGDSAGFLREYKRRHLEKFGEEFVFS